jgi:hypothetical protein
MAADPDGESIFSGLGKGDVAPIKIARITPGSLPADEEGALLQTLSHIDAGTTPTGKTSFRWGEPFSNNEGYLPGSSGLPSRYSEYRVTPPPGIRGGGTLRVVVDHLSNNVWYTWTHYGTAGMPPFVLIR